ncbi:MAG: hypothetical protein IT163_11420 [Bryobacterales bacterium]|nr:hypothetical protein [Bryobacterales bacterium]
MMKRRPQPELETGRVSVRASVSFPPDVYRILDDIAKQKKVSLAWVVRDAAEKYIADLWPLLKERHDRAND